MITKKDIEFLIGMRITQDLFVKSLEHAKEKQQFLAKSDSRVMQDGYLAQLVKEYITSDLLQQFTLDLCREVNNMKKRVPSVSQGTPIDNHIVAHSL